ncbi:tetratricopeptide repeat protein [Pseudodesulfovibrio tunisiensis]|uniref:tetratricopeptide repeat protein n=1 Tax=Pseudodesulfovibrio tunisiensis TaxID=463192 RepID=UPI001FB40019|nr:tetratricopeptide repeat protein [Pseudodesulfovibrio tunisiensis]
MIRTYALALFAALLICLSGCGPNDAPGMKDIRQAREAYSKGFFLEAEKGYEHYLQDQPQGKFREEAWERLAEISIAYKGDLERAVVLLEAMYLELGRDNELAWKVMSQLGDVYDQLGNWAKALESYEKCLAHAAGDPKAVADTQLRMAKLYRRQGNFDLVAATLENCADTASDPQARARCLYELAQSYSFINSWNQAKKSLERLLVLDGADEEIRALGTFLLADIYEAEREYAKARELLMSIRETYPNPKVVESRLNSLDAHAQ